jgi:hypothetical protein
VGHGSGRGLFAGIFAPWPVNEDGEGYSGIMVGSELRIVLQAEHLGSFFRLLQRGFQVLCPTGMGVKDFLCEWVGLDPGYVDARITTVFINGACVDNLEKALITKGTVLALSSAMPGLVGAMMRRNSAYSSLRSSITHTNMVREGQDGSKGTVGIKLFNFLLDELGPIFLEKGILVETANLVDFLRGRSQSFWDGCTEVVLDGMAVGPGSLIRAGQAISSGTTMLTVRVDSHGVSPAALER